MTNKLPFLGSCDRFRMKGEWHESFWQEMMANKTPATLAELETACQVSELLEEGETLEDLGADAPESGAWKSNAKGQDVYFFQTAGFEFIFSAQQPLNQP